MFGQSQLASPVALGAGRSIQPPAGWAEPGFVKDNPLWMKPKVRTRWCPPKVSSVSLHWELNSTPLPKDIMRYLIELLKRPGPIAIEQLVPLHPVLLRMPLDGIIEAEVLSYASSGSMLGLTYDLVDSDECGIVHYAPTENFLQGEFLIVGYEGTEPEFGGYFVTACKSLATFKSPAVNFDVKAPGPGTSGSHRPISPVSLPPAQTTTASSGGNKNGPLVGMPPHSHESLPRVQLPKNKVVAAPEPRKSGGTGNLTRPLQPRRRTSELQRIGSYVHHMQAGETIKGLVSKHWPDLDDSAVETKAREIYAFNRIHNNPLEAWNMKPGVKVFIPLE